MTLIVGIVLACVVLAAVIVLFVYEASERRNPPQIVTDEDAARLQLAAQPTNFDSLHRPRVGLKSSGRVASTTGRPTTRRP